MGWTKRMTITASDYSLLHKQMRLNAMDKKLTCKRIVECEENGMAEVSMAWSLFRANKNHSAYYRGLIEGGYTDGHINTALIHIFRDIKRLLSGSTLFKIREQQRLEADSKQSSAKEIG